MDSEFITKMNYINLEECSRYLHNENHLVCTSNMDFGCNLYNQGKHIISLDHFCELDDYKLVSDENMVCNIDNMLYRHNSGLFLIRDDVELDLLSTYNILLCRKYNQTNIAKTTVLNMLYSKISLRYATLHKQKYHLWLYFNAMIVGLRPVNVEVRYIHVDNYVKECTQLHVEIVNYFKQL